MENEETLNQQNTESAKGISFAEIFYVLRAHLILIIFITVLFAAGGFGYSKVRNPVYTASVPVLFNTQMFYDNTEESGVVNQTSSTTYVFKYIDTAVGICKSGEVVDRTNVYYQLYLNEKKETKITIDEFVNKLKSAYTAEIRAAHAEIPGYEITEELQKQSRNKFITASNIGTTYKSSQNASDTVVNFDLWVKNLNDGVAVELARIYAVAADVSLNNILDLGSGTAGLVELAKESKKVSVSPDMGARKIILIAAVLGFVISLLMVYLLYLTDNTVKSKAQLEKLTGSNVIAYLDDVAEVK